MKNGIKKTTLNSYSTTLYDLIRGCEVYQMSKLEMDKDFMNVAKARWFKTSAERFATLSPTTMVHQLCQTGTSTKIEIDIPETSPNEHNMILEVKLSIKVKE